MVAPLPNGYAAPRSAVADVSSGPTDEMLASRSARLGASLIDGLILWLPLAPAYAEAIRAILASKSLGAGGSPKLVFWSALVSSGFWFYVGMAATLVSLTLSALWVHRNGQTVGKKWLGIKDVRSDGSRATLARIFWLRYFSNTLFTLIPVIGSVYAIVDLMFIFGPAKRCCHDYLADTIVVRA